MSNKIFPCLLEVEKHYAKQYPSIIFETNEYEAKSYCPYSQTIGFERPKHLSTSLLNINVYEENSSIKRNFDESGISKSKGKYELQLYLYPILMCYDEQTPDRNPTKSIFLKELPTTEFILQFIKDTEPTSLKGFKNV